MEVESFKGRTILITGAAGFLGSHLGNRLAQLGANLFAIDNYLHPVGAPPCFKIERADVRFPEYLAIRARNCDAVVHMAAAINIDWFKDFPEVGWDINVNGVLNVLEACRRLDLPLVFASSSEIYGTAQATAISETHPMHGHSVYSASKIAGDALCRAYSKEQGMKISVVRMFNVFGIYQGPDSYGGVIAKFTKQALEGKPMTIYGSGEQRRDYTWYEDAVNAYLLALQKPFSEPTNFGTGTTISINELSTDIAHLVYGHAGDSWHATIAEHVAPRKGEVDTLRCDWSKAKSMGWSPKTTFADGLSQYVSWAKNQQV